MLDVNAKKMAEIEVEMESRDEKENEKREGSTIEEDQQRGRELQRRNNVIKLLRRKEKIFTPARLSVFLFIFSPVYSVIL